MCVRFDRRRMWTVLGVWPVTREADFIDGPAKNRLIGRPMGIVAREAGDAAAIHEALNEVVPLHPVLMGRAVREVREGQLAELVIFESPVIGQIQSDMKTYRPIVVLPINGILQGPTLRVTLDAGIVGMDVIHPSRIEDVVAR